MNICIDDKEYSFLIAPDGEPAWRIIDAPVILKFIISKGYTVLGGDILKSNLDYSYDSWYYNYNHDISINENSSNSNSKARAYINAYIRKNGINYYVVFVIKNHVWSSQGTQLCLKNTGDGSLC